MTVSFRKNKDGFTLIEAVMVIVLLGIVASGILMYFVGLGKSSDQASLVVATGLAGEKMERLLADSKANGFDTVIAEAPLALSAPFSKYTREVEAFCVQETDLNTSSGTMPGCADSDIRAKRVRVIVTWPDGSVDLTTVITDH